MTGPKLTAPEVVDEFSEFLKARAKALYLRVDAQAPVPLPLRTLPPLPKTDWLMAEIGTLLDKDDWDSADIARLSSLFFFLLVGPES
jgi:hypothetical protein